KRFFRFGKKGMADVLASPELFHVYGTLGIRRLPGFLWIETKSDSGKQTEAQKIFQVEVEIAGHSYIIVRRPEDLIEFLKANGEMRASISHSNRRQKA